MFKKKDIFVTENVYNDAITPGKRVYVKSVSGVRIPVSPQEIKRGSKPERQKAFANPRLSAFI